MRRSRASSPRGLRVRFAASRNVGEIDVNLPQLISTTTGDKTHFGFDFDDAPAILVPNQTDPSAAPPGQDSSAVRNLEHEVSRTTEFDPITGQTIPITVNMADQTEEQILHIVNADPRRTPTFTLFGNDDFFFQTIVRRELVDSGLSDSRAKGSPGTTATSSPRSRPPGRVGSDPESGTWVRRAASGPTTPT